MQRFPSILRSIVLVALMLTAGASPMALPGPSDHSPKTVEQATSGRAQTTWSGTVFLSTTTTLAVTDEQVIS
ncbi:MAG: hypothetical protein VXX03_06170, partial [Candidatus Thermoplasmatota archaeon]|nr:hypothetical protein [Candidatus Thermoplasmatota archaeon]